MNLKIVAIIFLLVVSAGISGQTATEINKTDDQGRKQGHWIKKYPNSTIMYDGIFKDNHPVGEFKRFFESSTLRSVLIYNKDGNEAIATIYHENGYISSKGTFINQLKEGKWQFFSEFTKGYLVSEEFFTGNIKNGPSLKFYPDSTVAERLIYKNNVTEGECIQYYPKGTISMKSNYLNGKFNGRFEVWFVNGQIEFSGQYKNDVKDGIWFIYKNDGTVKYKITYIDGVTKDHQMDIDESDYLDSLEKNKGKIADPEKSGVMW
jgi:antitoxin component YwqK of YwqJK toxin-antitoxin module